MTEQVVTAIWHKTASPLQMDDSIVFASSICQCALPCGHIGATWWIRLNSCFLYWRIRLNLCFLWPTQAHNTNSKSIGAAVSAQLTAESSYTLQWAPLSPKIAPSYSTGDLDPYLMHGSLGTQVLNPNGISIGLAVFAVLTSVTDRPTDHDTQWVTTDRIYVSSMGDAV